MNAKSEDLNKIEGIGEVVAESLAGWLGESANHKLVKDLTSAGVEVLNEKPKANGKFTGTTWVFTGTLNEFSREEAGAKVRALGGEVTNSVSKNTSYVVAGEEPGSKYDKAKSLGVNIISELDFKNKIK
jgi:DNA ligase (NAD+)